MTKTEKLRKVVKDVLYDTGCPSSLLEFECDKVLKACKESGLMFTRTGVVGDDLEGACICKVEEIWIK